MANVARATSPVVIVADDATVIRVSALRAMYAEAGDYKTLGEALGLSASTLCRALREEPKRDPVKARVARVRAMLPAEAAGR